MENLLKQLIELDRRARSLVDEAKRQEAQSRQHLEELRSHSHADSAKLAAEQLEALRAQFQGAAERQIQNEQAQYQQTLNNLRQRFHENREAWLGNIVSACIGESVPTDPTS